MKPQPNKIALHQHPKPVGESGAPGRSADYVAGCGPAKCGGAEEYRFGRAYGPTHKHCLCPQCGRVIDCASDACECGCKEPGVWC